LELALEIIEKDKTKPKSTKGKQNVRGNSAPKAKVKDKPKTDLADTEKKPKKEVKPKEKVKKEVKPKEKIPKPIKIKQIKSKF